MVTGLVEVGEDITAAAEREVLEETGVRARFDAVLAFRQSHGFAFGKSDFFFVVALRQGLFSSLLPVHPFHMGDLALDISPFLMHIKNAFSTVTWWHMFLFSAIQSYNTLLQCAHGHGVRRKYDAAAGLSLDRKGSHRRRMNWKQ
jgi:ADP-ribose pyrophosphatase YjhB (NUDIX family)